jgi:cytochrome c oxidase subunit 3
LENHDTLAIFRNRQSINGQTARDVIGSSLQNNIMMRSLIYARGNPYVTMLILAMGGSVIFFLVIVVAYANRIGMPDWKPVPIPAVFWVSTFIMIFSSFTLHQANDNYKAERYDHYKNWIGFTTLLGAIFLLSQAAGWFDLITMHHTLTDSISAAFLYLMSGVHALHIILGLVVLLLIYRDAVRSTDYVDGFIGSLDPVKSSRLKLMTIYWHFVDVLWFCLFLLFLAQG